MTTKITVHNGAESHHAVKVAQNGKPDAVVNPGQALELTIYDGAEVTSITETEIEKEESQDAAGDQPQNGETDDTVNGEAKSEENTDGQAA